MALRRRQSLRWRLPLFITGLIAVILVAYLWAANRVIEITLVRIGVERAQTAAAQIANVLTQTGDQGIQLLNTAAASAPLRAFVHQPTDAVRAQLTRSMTAQNPNSPRRVEVWNAKGERLFEVAQPGGTGEAPPPCDPPAAVGIQPMRVIGDGVESDSVVAIHDEPADGATDAAGPVIGYLIVRSTLSATNRPRLIESLVGAGAILKIGNQAGGAWTDLARVVDAPPQEVLLNTGGTYTVGGAPRVGAMATIRDTPWVVTLEFPRSAIVAPARAVLFIMAGLAVLFIIVGGTSVGFLTARMSAPLLEVSAAAAGLSAGDYSRRVRSTRSDEIGDLARSFNAMAGKLEEATRHQAQLASIVESSEDAIISKALDGTVQTWNAGATHLYGYDASEMIGRSIQTVFPRDQWAQMLQILHQVEEGQSIRNSETVRLRKDGSRVNVSLTVSPIRDLRGTVIGASTIARDITELKLAEAARLRGVQLQEESRRAHEANRLKSEFLANMSHELRTPLNAIIGFTDLIHKGKAGPVSPDQEEYLGDILTSSRHLLQLINDILDLAKVEAGRMEFRPEHVDLNKLTKEVGDVLRGLAASKRLRVATTIDPAVALVTVDAARVKQILYNYLSNAIKFTPEGGSIDVRVTPEGAKEFRIEVQDTGPGIPHEELGRLFVEFQQLDEGSSKRHQGTGLGLALTKRLVEAHGGRVGVRSTPGHGSTFVALLPREMSVTPAGALEPREIVAGPAARRILVVEDDARERTWLVDTLREAGYQVDSASNGADAIAKCGDQCYDAITLDLLLPDMHGWQALDGIRSDTPNAGAAVVAISLFSEGVDAASFHLHDYIVKPVTADALLTSIGRIHRSSSPSKPLGPQAAAGASQHGG